MLSLRSLPLPCLAGLGAAVSLVVLTSAAPSQAQSSGCDELGPQLTERKNLVQAIQNLGGKDKKMEPKAACSAFGKLANNGTTILKWAEINKDWCRVPDQFVEGIKADHERVVKMRGQACDVAAKHAEAEKKARPSLLGGDGLEGTYKIPKGAL